MNLAPEREAPHAEDLLQRLDSVRMHSCDRTIAKKHVAQAERTVNGAFQAMRVFHRAASELVDRIFPRTERQRDAYLSAAVDRTDLEQRIRNWERRPTPFWDRV
jgi:hypothetical protein